MTQLAMLNTQAVLNQQQWHLIRVLNEQTYIHVDALAKDLNLN